VKKFEGLEIIYRKMLEDKNIHSHQNLSKRKVVVKNESEFENLTRQMQEIDIKYQR
jgi:hypothetical protein